MSAVRSSQPGRRAGYARQAVALLPGLALTAAVAWLGLQSSAWLGHDLMGFPESPISGIMMAIVFGLLLGNLVRLPAAFTPGIQFSLKRVLRLGIILLGIRLGIADVLQLGALGIPLILICIAGGLAFTHWLARRLGLSSCLGTLIAVGTSICGASAIVATGPAIDAKEEEITYAVANITVFGILAMFVYPYLAHWLWPGAAMAAGLFLGTSIHETAQVAGAGLIYAQVFATPSVLDVATVTKLMRNLLMVVVIPLMAYLQRRRTLAADAPGKRVRILSLFPLFILGFLLLAVVRSIGEATLRSGLALGLFDVASWSALVKGMQTAATDLLAMAMAGVGLGTSLRKLRGLGLKPFYGGLGAAVAVGALSLVGIMVLTWAGLGGPR